MQKALHKALYRKWRPKSFDDVYGQEHIITVLKNQCNAGKTSHAYLFCGTRGTGKTTAAKILAAAVNCLQLKDGNPCGVCENCQLIDSGAATDINEIDAASNNSVDDIRNLRDEVVYSPAALKKRVYIIDEVHMLSTSAFNALLKTLEEPPDDVVFILATTELNKIPPTILSRCQRLEFRRIDQGIICNRLKLVAEKEGIKLDKEAAELIAKLADGGMRDALSMLESCASGNEDTINVSFVQDRLGVAGADVALDILEAIYESNVSKALVKIVELHSSAKDFTAFLNELLRIVRDMMMYARTGDKNIISTFLSKDETQRLEQLSKAFTTEQLLYFADVLEDCFYRLGRYSSNKRFELEMAIIRLCDITLDTDTKALAARIAKLEAGGVVIKAVEKMPYVELEKETVVEQVRQPNIEHKKAIKAKSSAKQISSFIDAFKHNTQIYAILQSSDIQIVDDEVIIGCDPFGITPLTKSQNLLEAELEKYFGKSVKVKITDRKNCIIEEKSSLDDIKIY